MTNQELLNEIMDQLAHKRELAEFDVDYSEQDKKSFYRGKSEAYRQMMGFVRFLKSREEEGK